MGDRGNIAVRQSAGTNKDDVWFYTHWEGSRLMESVRTTICRGNRWGDAQYLTRMIFNDLQGDDRGDTGFGISTGVGDNEHPIVIVDIPARMVRTVEKRELVDVRLPNEISQYPGTSFAEIKAKGVTV